MSVVAPTVGQTAAPSNWETVPGVGYRLTVPDLGIRFDLTRVRKERQETVGLLTVRATFRGARTVADNILSSSDFNCSGQTARQARAKFLGERSRAEEIDWMGWLEQLCLRVLAEEDAGEEERPLEQVPLDDDREAEMEPGGVPVLRRHPTIWFGDGGCVAGETLIQGPNGAERIDTLAALGQPITVYALSASGPVAIWAHAPVARGLSDLYRFDLSDGRSVLATMEHRFLTPTGWQYAAVLRVGDAVAVAAPCLPASYDAACRSTSAEGDHRWLESIPSSPAHYSTDSHRDDARRLTGSGIGLSPLPSLIGVRGHNLASWRADASAGESGRSHPGQRFARPSRSDSFPAVPSLAGAGSYTAASRATPHSANNHSVWPSRRVSHQQPPRREWIQSEAAAAVGPCAYATVTAISFVRRDVFYDLTVPGLHNYLANGIWHHNCGKSYLALYAGLHLMLQGERVLYLDWEFAGEDHRRRLHRLAGPVPDADQLFYRRCERPLVRDVSRIKEIIAKRKITFLICDSLGFAAEGAPEAAEAATGYFRALRELGPLGSLHLAHISKAEQGDQKPFGSVFWNNGARATWFLKRTDADPSHDGLSVGLFHRKSNVGRLRPAFGMAIQFAGTSTTIRPAEVGAHQELAVKLPIWQRMQQELRHGAREVGALAEELGIQVTTIRSEVTRKPALFTRIGDGRIGLVARP